MFSDLSRCSLSTVHWNAVRAGRRVDALFGEPEPLYRPSVDQVLLHNLRGVFRLDVPVPNGLGINHYGWAVLALVKTSCLIDANCVSKARSPGKLLKLRVQFALSVGCARGSRSTLRPHVVANKNVVPEQGQTSLLLHQDYRAAGGGLSHI